MNGKTKQLEVSTGEKNLLAWCLNLPILAMRTSSELGESNITVHILSKQMQTHPIQDRNISQQHYMNKKTKHMLLQIFSVLSLRTQPHCSYIHIV
jgi:hypothetical protein